MSGGPTWGFEDSIEEDIAEQGEQLRQAQHAEFQSLIDAIDDVLFRLDGDNTIQFVNEAVEPTLGFTPDDLVGEPLETLLAHDGKGVRTHTWESSAELLSQLASEDTSELVVAFRTVEDDSCPMELSASIVSQDDGYVCLASDISDRQRIEQERDQYEQLVEAVDDPMYVLDDAGTLQRVNDAMVEYTGYERSELIGRQIGELIPAREYDRATQRLAELAAAEEKQSETFETTLVTKRGELILTEANVTVLVGEDGEYTGSVGALRDIRDRKQRERELDMLKQVLIRVFRHNVRNELSVVQGNAEHVHRQVDDQLEPYTDKIIERSEQLLDHTEKARLIEEVIGSEDRYEIDLAVAVEKIVRSYSDTYPDATIDVSVPDATTVQAHPKIESAIEELLDNAIQHAPDGTDPQIEIWIDRTDEHLTLFVEDESGGLADHEIEVLRKGAESDLEHGSGVGLWLVRWAVEYSNADMIAHRTDEGSLMGIRFPRSDREATDEESDIEDSPFARVPAHVRGDISPERFHGEIVIGRMEELHELEDAYESLQRKGGHAVLVTGETGVGKSTLVEQFQTRLEDHEDTPLLTSGSCDPEMTAPYQVFRQAMDELPVATELQELLTDVAEFSADDPETVQRRKQALFADIADELRELAIDHPVVLVVEDLQWADRGSLDLFEYLIEEVGRWAPPILFVGTYRIEDVGRTHPVIEIAEQTAETGRGTLLELDPFDHSDVENLVGYMLDIEELPAEFVSAVADHTGGTPLFVAEIGRHLAETLGPNPTPADLPADLATVSVPDSIESAVTERLAELSQPVTTVLEVGAVIGETISFDVLREASDRPEAELVEIVDTLVERRIWSRTEGRLQFVHGVMREKAIAGLDTESHESLHRRVATAIESVYAESLAEQSGRLAFHYHEAGELDTALEYYQQAGDHAAETYAHRTAIDHYEQALAIASSLEKRDEAIAAGYRLAEITLAIGEYDEAETYVQSIRDRLTDDEIRRKQRVAGLAAKIGAERGEYDMAQREVRNGIELDETPSEELCHLLNMSVRVSRGQGEYEKAKETANRLRELAGDIDAPAQRAEAILNLGIIEWRQSNNEQAREHVMECFNLSEILEDQQLQGECLNILGVIAWGQSDYDQAREYYEQSREIKQEIGDRHGEAKTLNNLGLVAQEQGQYDQATAYYEQCLETYRNLGDRHTESKTLNNLGILARIQSDYDQAREYYQQSKELERDIGDREGEAKSLNNLGEIDRRQGNYERAREYFEQSLTIKRDLGNRRDAAETLTHQGLLACRRGNLDKASQKLKESLAIARELEMPSREIDSLRGLGMVECEQENYEQAQRHLDKALQGKKNGGDPLPTAQAQLAAGRVALACDELELANEYETQARETFEDLGSRYWIGRCQQLAGEIAAERNNLADAYDCWARAVETFEEVDAPQDTLATLDRLIETSREHDESEIASEWCEKAIAVLADAPAPVAAQHREWIDERASELDIQQ